MTHRQELITIEVVVEQQPPNLAEYARIPIAFEVKEVFEVKELPSGKFDLIPSKLPHPYLKDYDSLDEGPSTWSSQFNFHSWHWFSAWRTHDHQRVECLGRGIIVTNSPEIDMLEGRDDLALLWDIRVARHARHLGIGSALFQAMESWCHDHGCREMKVETQQINVPACRFYQRMGFKLRTVNRDAYQPELPNEIQLLWYKEIASTAHGSTIK